MFDTQFSTATGSPRDTGTWDPSVEERSGDLYRSGRPNVPPAQDPFTGSRYTPDHITRSNATRRAVYALSPLSEYRLENLQARYGTMQAPQAPHVQEAGGDPARTALLGRNGNAGTENAAQAAARPGSATATTAAPLSEPVSQTHKDDLAGQLAMPDLGRRGSSGRRTPRVARAGGEHAPRGPVSSRRSGPERLFAGDSISNSSTGRRPAQWQPVDSLPAGRFPETQHLGVAVPVSGGKRGKRYARQNTDGVAATPATFTPLGTSL